MSTISFHGGHDGRPPSPSSSSTSGFFGSAYNVSSSFQMNPLSAHPPRTPKTSLTSSEAPIENYITTQSHPPQEQEKIPDDVEEDDFVPVVEQVKDDTKDKVRPTQIWREIFRTSTGRDKAFKIIQYTLRVYLLLHRTLANSAPLRKPTRPEWELELLRRLDSTVSGLSTTRKCLIMFNWLNPLTSILASQPIEFSMGSTTRLKEPSKPLVHAFLHAPPPVLLDLLNGLSDDVYAFYRLGLLGKKTGERAGKFSDWCWLAGTVIALVELSFERSITKNKIQAAESRLYAESLSGGTANSKGSGTRAMEKELEKLQRQDYWLKIQRTKLLMDFVFVCYDVFHIPHAGDTVRAFTGLTSAILSSARLYQTHRNTLIMREVQR